MNDWFTVPPPVIPMPDRAGHVAPVFWEPLAGSGERICIAVLGYNLATGEIAAASLSAARLRCLGDMGASLGYFGLRVGESFRDDVKSGVTPEDWQPRYDGMHRGGWQEAFGHVLAAVTADHLETYSSLWQPGRDDDQLPPSPLSRPRPQALRRFVGAIRGRVEKVNSQLATLFDQHYSLTPTHEKAKSTVDYLSSRYAACYAVLMPRSKHARLYANDSLWRLARAREMQLVPPDKVETVLWVPDPEMPLFSEEDLDAAREHTFELQAEAQKEGIDVATVTSAEAAAGRLLSAEAYS